jgi:hypothetical protein
VLDDAIASFAMAYAKQTILDHAALVKAKDPATSAKTITARPRKGCLEQIRKSAKRFSERSCSNKER